MKLLELETASTKEILKEFLLPNDLLTKTRLDSIKKFQELGLPRIKSEIFSKTGVKLIYQNDYLKNKKSGSYTNIPSSDNYRIVFKKGFYCPLQSNLPDGIKILFDTEPIIKDQSINPFYYLTKALNNNFYIIEVQKDLNVKTPVEIIYLDELYKSQTHMYITLKLKKNAKINLFEKVLIDNSSFFNHTFNVILEKGSEITHVRQQSAELSSNVISNYNYTLDKNSNAKIYSYEDGSDLSLAIWDIDLIGENADIDFTVLQLPKMKQKLNTIVNIKHSTQNARSNQLIKQIINDEAKGLVDAKVIVCKNAQGTKVKQLCNSLLLSDKAGAQAYVKPQLEIYTDELEASHGATVGSLSQEQLYYLMSRGIKEEDAKVLLIEAFKKEAYESFPSWAKEKIDEYQYSKK